MSLRLDKVMNCQMHFD